jgi:hypothetical protein
MDPFRHARAVALLNFPCPPLPIMGNFIEELGEYSIINSHDMLSAFIISAFKRQNPEANAIRKAKQIDVNNRFCSILGHITHQDCDFNVTYSAMATFTRDYLQTYHEQPMDIRMLGHASISPSMQMAIGDYFKAQCTLNGETLRGDELNFRDGLYGSVQSLLKGSLFRVFQRQQGVVREPVFEGVDEDVGEEGEDPEALKCRVEILGECVEPVVGCRDHSKDEKQGRCNVQAHGENVQVFAD